MAGMDVWLITLRCDSSPPIDWSRLGFGVVAQLSVLGISAMIALTDDASGGPVRWRFPVEVLVAAAFTFILVRQPLLLSDTIYDKTFESGSFSCPGVPEFWRPDPERHKPILTIAPASHASPGAWR